MVLPLIAAIFAGTAAVAGVASIAQGQRASRAQRRALQAQREGDNLRAAKARRDTIREGRIRFAAAQQNAENQGVGSSSGAQGGQGSILTQLASNVSFIDDQQTAARVSGAFMDRAAKASSYADMWSSLSSLGFMGAGADWNSIMGGDTAAVAQPPAYKDAINNAMAWKPTTSFGTMWGNVGQGIQSQMGTGG